MCRNLEYLLRVVYIWSRIVMEEIFLIKKIINSEIEIDHQFRNWIDPMSDKNTEIIKY